jgi:Transposase
MHIAVARAIDRLTVLMSRAAESDRQGASRELYKVEDYELTGQFVDELIRQMSDKTWSTEVRSPGRTLKRWRSENIAWHKLHITHRPTESKNSRTKGVTHTAIGLG